MIVSLAFFVALLQLLRFLESTRVEFMPSEKQSNSRRRDRAKTVNMDGFTHNFLSLRLMFGSRRFLGTLLAILLLSGAAYLVYNYMADPSRGLRHADQMWNRDKNVEAVREYKALLMKRDPLDHQFALIPGPERPRLFRRIISHEARYGNRAEARDWITAAYGEGINFEQADFEDQEVHQLWLTVIADYQDPSDARKERNLLDEMMKKE